MGFIRDVFIAKYLGVSLLSDAFFAAFRLPNFFRRIFAEGAFNSAFVPIFIEKLDGKKNEDLNFARNVFSLLFYCLLIFTILIQIFMPFVMKLIFPGFFDSPEKSELLISLSRITIFYLIFISMVSLLSGILNSLGKFAVPAAAPILLNGTLVLAIFILGPISPTYAHALSWGVFAAGILQFIFLFIFTVKSGYLLYPKWPKINEDIKKFFKKILPGIIGANVMQINLLIDSIFASMIFGAVSYLYYSDRINQLPLAMIGIAIGIALLPSLSKKIRDKKDDEAIKLQNIAIEVGLILVIPAATALSILALPIITTLFERGEFTATQSNFVANALGFYALGLPAYVLVKIMEPSFFSRGDTKTPMKIAFICMLANIISNCTFYYFKFGYLGIVLSSVICGYLNLTLLTSILIFKKHFHFEKELATRIPLILVPSIFMGIFLFFAKNYFAQNQDFNIILELIFMIGGGLIIYLILSLILGNLKILFNSPFLKKSD